MKVVIMAGGRGTRIAEIKPHIPKPMITVGGMPILEYQIRTLESQGFKDIILVIGYLGDIIRNYFKDGGGVSPKTGRPFGVSIHYIEESEPLGTAGSFVYFKELIKEDFLLVNGDIIFDIDICRFYNYHKSKGGLATIFTHPNDHPYDSGIICVDHEKRVVDWLHKENDRLWYKNRVNAGLHILSEKILQWDLFQKAQKIDLDREVLKPLILDRALVAYDSPEYVKDMGTPERYNEVAEDIQNGKVELKNLSKKQKAIFLDRDGTINKYVGFLRSEEDFVLLDGVSDAVRKINHSGYLAIVVTNQPVVARGDVTMEGLEKIHHKMETLLGEQGAYLDAIYYCPHHPHGGFEGEIKELKITCSCRKPNPGMLLQAADDFNIDLTESWIIGDRMSDVLAGRNAGCKTMLLTEQCGEQGTCHTLLQAIDIIFESMGII